MSIRSLIFTIAQSPGSTSARASPESTSRALMSWPLYISFTEVMLPRFRLPFLAERDDAMLDGDEVALAEIPGRAIAARPVVVVGVELGEARAAFAKEVEGQQPHLVLQLPLHVGDDAKRVTYRRWKYRRRSLTGRSCRRQGASCA